MNVIGIRGNGGAALMTAIVFVFFLTLFGLAYYQLAETDLPLLARDRNLSNALYASEAGLEKVRWMITESHQISGANPFSNSYVEANALSTANPTDGDFFPGEADKAYYKVSQIQAAGSKVKVRVLGSVDVDADGEAGLTTTEDGFTFDPDDSNRTFEAKVGLPGALGEDVSAAAKAFYAGGVEINLSPEGRSFTTQDGDQMAGFLYFGSGVYGGIWDRWNFIFSDPVKTGEIELPPGIFDTDGNYIDDDADSIPDYFQDLDLRIYAGNQTFTPSNDPTAGANGRSVIYVNGNIAIDGIDFGYLNDQGEVKGCDWEKTDLAFIANGDITVNRADCGNVGRLVLVAKNITLVGDYNTKLNGIAIALNDITLDGTGCTNGILTLQADYSRPVRYTAYFMGSMAAGNHINLLNDGWTVIYDQNVINGYMYSTTIPKPTLTYERVEAEDFNLSNNWQVSESPPQMLYTQGVYTQDEIDTMQGNYGDGGEDTLPELMRVYTDRASWGPSGPHALGEALSLDFASGDFEDPDISDVSLQDWDYYDTIAFWMALDNLKRTSTDGTKTTRREARYEIRLKDGGGNTISIPLSSLYPETEWGTVRYHHAGEDYMNEIRDLTATEKANGETYSKWKRIKITPNDFDPSVNFDFSTVEEFNIAYTYLKLSWTVVVGKPDAKVEWMGSYFRYTDEDGNERSIDGKDNKGKLNNDPPPTANDGYYYLYDEYEPGKFFWIWWNEDPNSSPGVRMREEVLMPTLRIDRIELPGKPATNNFLEYGLPRCLRLDVTDWREL